MVLSMKYAHTVVTCCYVPSCSACHAALPCVAVSIQLLLFLAEPNELMHVRHLQMPHLLYPVRVVYQSDGSAA